MKYKISRAAKRLKKIRQERGLTQADIHRLTKQVFPPKGVSKSAIAQIECGMKEGRYVWPMIAAALSVSLDDLMGKR